MGLCCILQDHPPGLVSLCFLGGELIGYHAKHLDHPDSPRGLISTLPDAFSRAWDTLKLELSSSK
jgi:hypothetical protein